MSPCVVCSSKANVCSAAFTYKILASSATLGCAPKRLNNGICRDKCAHRLSMVKMRNRDGFSINCQLFACACCKAFRLKSYVICLCACDGGVRFAAAIRLSKMRSRISAAALLVKVMAIISSGAFTVCNSFK